MTPKEIPLNRPDLAKTRALFTEPKPITLTPETVSALKTAFEVGGINLKLSEEARQSLIERQLRNWSSGRGPGLSEALGDRRDEFDEWLTANCEGFKMKLGDDRTRGARQFAADLVSLAVGINPEETIQKINSRLFRSWLLYAKKHHLTPEQIRENFSGVPEPEATMASFDPEIIPNLIGFLAGEPQN